MKRHELVLLKLIRLGRISQRVEIIVLFSLPNIYYFLSEA